jgi:hypothetical protein
MKGLLFLPLLIATVFCSTYLDGLNRTFDEIEQKVVDLYVTMPTAQVNDLLKKAQISVNDVSSNYGKKEDFKYEEAKIVAKWNGKEKTYEKVSFKTGGMYARSNDKVGFNIKLDKKFLGRKNIRLRPDPTDTTKLRSKISCDIANRMGVPSIQASFARLYMNGEFWGFYTLMDAIKPSWIKQTFSPTEEEITTLYQCKNGGFKFTTDTVYQCINANDDYQHMTAFKNFVTEVNKCKTIDEVDKIFEVDVFLKYLAFEWLIGSFDHFLVNGHNLYFYQRESDKKWTVIYYDYDNTFGTYLTANKWDSKGANQDGSGGVNQWGQNTRGNNPITYTFADWEMNLPIVKLLVHKNQSRFKKIVREVLVSAFNPDLLNPHIHELKHFLKPYVTEDYTPKNGKLPGRINNIGSKHTSSLTEFENTVESSLKAWISTKFDVACKNYGFNKNDILNESAKYVAKSYDYPFLHEEPKDKKTTTTTTTTTTIKKTTTTTTTKKTTTTTTTKKTTTTTTTKKTTTTTTTKKPTTTTIKKTTTTTTTTKKSTTTTTNPPSVIPTPKVCDKITKGFYACGGLNYPDASPCCETGYRCEYQNDYYYMCAPYTSGGSGGNNNNDPVYVKVETIIAYQFDGKDNKSATETKQYTQKIEGKSGTFGELKIDANNGKLAARGTDTQFNAGTKISFTAKANGSFVITSYPGYHSYTIKSGSAKAVAVDSDSKKVSIKAGEIYVIEATNTAYLYSLVITYQPDSSNNGGSTTTTKAVIAYQFDGKNNNSATETKQYTQKIEGKSGTFGELKIDANNGKLAARGTDTQFNAGTKISFTAKANGSFVITSYPGYHSYTIKSGSAKAVAVDSDSKKVSIKAGETYVIEATATAYLYSLVITYN